MKILNEHYVYNKKYIPIYINLIMYNYNIIINVNKLSYNYSYNKN